MPPKKTTSKTSKASKPRKTNQLGNDKAKRLREGRLEVVAQLYRRGYSLRHIQAEVTRRLDLASYSLATVHNDVKYLLSEWRENRIEDIDQTLQLELERIDEAVRELWEQWEQSKLIDSLGDVSYITEIRRQLEERRKLLGLYAPEKKDISGGVSFASFLMESGALDSIEASFTPSED